MEKQYISITVVEYESLVDDSNFLKALRAAGVDNWQWYDDAIDIYDEMEKNG